MLCIAVLATAGAVGMLGCAVANGQPDSSVTAIGVTAASNFRCTATGSNAAATIHETGLSDAGTTDDSSAIQEAINSAASDGGGVVALPAGRFVIDRSLVLKSNVKLTGVGPKTVLQAGPKFLSRQGPGGGYPVVTTAGASNVTIANLTADQNGDNLNGNVAARLNGYVVEGWHSSNVVIDHVYVRNAFTYSIAVVNSSNFCINSSNVLSGTNGKYNQLDGIHVLDSSYGQVINNVIKSGDDGLAAHTIGAAVHNVTYANNVVHGGAGDSGLQIAVGVYPVYDITVENNNFSGSYYGIWTGYYTSHPGSVTDVTMTRNYVHNLTDGNASSSAAIGGAGPVKDIVASRNRVCDAGPFKVQSGTGNSVVNTTYC